MAHDDFSGSTLGQYELRQIIGVGGMGTVYRAYQISLQREVAVKVLSRNLTVEYDSNTRFIAEAKIAASLEHPHIVPVYDYGTQDGVSYIVMRWLTGGSLDAAVNRYKALKTISILLGQLASALDYTHRQGVIHRDIKTSNVLFDQFGVPYLTDFGIAKILTEMNALTTTGRIIGTPSYMAPELWRNEPASAASDIYALGILAYTLLAGTPPFQATTPYALMRKHLYESPLLSASLPEVTPEITMVLRRALAKRADDRYQTAGAFAQAIQEAVQDNQSSTIAAQPAAKSVPTVIFTPVDSLSSLDYPTVTPVDSSQLNQGHQSKADINRTRIRVGVVLVLFLFIAGFLLVRFGMAGTTSNNQFNSTLQSSSSARAVAVLSASATPTTRMTSTPKATDTYSPTNTPVPSLTFTATTTPTTKPSRTATASPSPTATTAPTLTASATLTLLPNATASPVMFVGPVTPYRNTYNGELTAAIHIASQSFNWKAGEVVTICLSSPDFDFDPYLSLEDASRIVLAESDDYKGTKTACIVNYIVPSTAIYTVVMTSYGRNEIGSYQLEVISLAQCALKLPIGRVNQKDPINLRSRPIVSSTPIGVVLPNECFALIGRNASTTWWKIRTADGRDGWVMSGLLETIGNTQSLPILQK